VCYCDNDCDNDSRKIEMSELPDDVTCKTAVSTIHSVRPDMTAPLADLMSPSVDRPKRLPTFTAGKNVCSSLKTARAGIAKQY